MPKSTLEQELAINTSGTNIIVSAGAGSGKTAVLTKRVVTKLKKGISINKLLVLTFTKEAANEMKDRIRSEIKKEGLTKELDYIDSAYITTFDSYALSIVKKYHYLLNVSNKVSIIDSALISVIKSKLMDEIFDSHYGEDAFEDFISTYSIKDDAIIKKGIIKLSSKMDLIIDKSAFLDNYIDTYYTEENISSLVTKYQEYVISEVKELRKQVYELVDVLDDTKRDEFLEVFNPILNSTNYGEVRNNINTSIPRLSSGSTDEVKSMKEEIKKHIDKIKNLVRFENTNELIEDLKSTKKYAEVIVSLIKELDEKLMEYKFSIDKFEFIDIAKLAIKVVRENEDIREELKNYYHEIMIDEYQDTNDLQEEFVRLIMNNNVYVVGDIKQSIYRFRNANPNIFRDKYLKYQDNDGGIKIDLLKNFRSRKEVIDDINKIFNRLMNLSYGDADYEQSHQMIFGNLSYEDESQTASSNGLSVLVYENEGQDFTREEIEAFIIAEDIKKKLLGNYQVMEKETGKLRKLDYKDICIIIDRTSSFNLYKKIFEYYHIPLTLYKDEVLSEQEDMYLIKNAIGLLIHIKEKNFDQEFKYYMTSIMRSFLYGFNDTEIFECFKNNNFKDNKVYKDFDKLASLIDTKSIYDITCDLFKLFNIYEQSLTKNNIKSSFVRYEYLLNLSSTLSELGYTIYDYKEYLEDMINEGIEIRYPVNTRGKNSVKLMTIHKSKGLEFPICYFSGFYKTFNKDDLKDMFMYDSDFGIILPIVKEETENLFVKDLLQNKFNKEEISEKIRLLYVALTRARESMIIVLPNTLNDYSSSYILSDTEKSKYKSFLMMMDSVKNTIKPNTTEVSDYSYLTHDYEKSSKTKIKDIESSEVKIEKLKNEITYEKVNENRYSKNEVFINTPETKSAMEYGLKVHYILETEDFKTSNNKIVRSLLDLIGVNGTENYYKEYEFIYEKDDEVKHGIIDLIVETDSEIKIIDYKLSNIDDEAYIKQLLGYKNYIESITDKEVSIYLYSILKNTLKRID